MLKTSLYLQKRQEWYNERVFLSPTFTDYKCRHICFPHLYYYYLLKILKVSCTHHNLLGLNVSPGENYLLHNHSYVNCSQTPLSMGFFQAKILEWVTIASSRGSSRPRDQTGISCIGGQILYLRATWEAPHCLVPSGYL